MPNKSILELKQIGWNNLFAIYTNLIYIIFGLYILYNDNMSNLYSLLWSCAFIYIGISSYLFHKNMTKFARFLDGNSMIFIETLLFITSIFFIYGKNYNSFNFIISIILLWLILGYIDYKYNKKYNIIIDVTLVILSILILCKSLKNNCLLYLYIAIFAWIINIYKIFFDHGIFHGFWHIFTGFSLYEAYLHCK